MIPQDLTVIPTPVIIFTQDDANKAVGLCKVETVKGCKNIVTVNPVLTVEDFPKAAYLQVLHMTKKEKSGKEKKVKAWNVRFPIFQVNLNDDTMHVFKIDSSELDVKDASTEKINEMIKEMGESLDKVENN